MWWASSAGVSTSDSSMKSTPRAARTCASAKCPIRALAITGTVTAALMPSMRAGSLIRATPPSRRMSAGTRSRAMTATAPASSATLACSASTTSMITPPRSISASPRFTVKVPVGRAFESGSRAVSAIVHILLPATRVVARTRHRPPPRGGRCRQSGRTWPGSGLEDGFQLDLDVDLLGDDQATGLHDRTEGDTEILTVDGGRRAEPDPMVAVRVLHDALEADVEGDGLGHPADGQISFELELGRGLRLDGRAGEGPGGVVLHVEEIVGLEMTVTILVTGVHTAGLDGDRRLGVGRVLGQDEGALERTEPTTDLGHRHVADGEPELGVGGIDVVGTHCRVLDAVDGPAGDFCCCGHNCSLGLVLQAHRRLATLVRTVTRLRCMHNYSG